MKVLLITLLFSTALLYADRFEYHSHKHIQKELSHIQLNSRQKTAVKKILQKFRQQLKEYRELKKKIQKEKERLFVKNRLQLEQLNRLEQEACQKAKTIENEFLLQMHHILNREQRKRFIEYFDDWEVE